MVEEEEELMFETRLDAMVDVGAGAEEGGVAEEEEEEEVGALVT